MTKRFRQASLSLESLAVDVEDSEDLQVQGGGGNYLRLSTKILIL